MGLHFVYYGRKRAFSCHHQLDPHTVYSSRVHAHVNIMMYFVEYFDSYKAECPKQSYLNTHLTIKHDTNKQTNFNGYYPHGLKVAVQEIHLTNIWLPPPYFHISLFPQIYSQNIPTLLCVTSCGISIPVNRLHI